MNNKCVNYFKKNVNWIFFSIVVLFFVFTCFFVGLSQYDVVKVSIFSFVLIVLEVVLFVLFKIKLNSLYAIGLLIFNLFYFGTPLAVFFSSSFDINSYIYWLSFSHSVQVTNETLTKAYLLSMACSFLLAALRCVITKIKPVANIFENQLLTVENKKILNALFLAFIFLAVVSFVPYCWTQFSSFLIVIKKGYAFVYNNDSVPGIIQTIAPFFNISLLFGSIYFCYCKGKKSKIFYIIFSLFVVVELFEMIKGTRIKQVIYLIIACILFAQRMETKKSKVIYGVVLFFGTLIGLTILTYISFARSSGGASFGGFFEFAFTNGLGAVFAKTLIEYGNTIKSLYLAIEFFPSYHNYFYGLTYIFSFASVYPNTFNLYGDFVNYYSFVNFLPKSTQYSLGGSILGEAYANFGFVGSIVFMLFVGLGLFLLSSAFKKATQNKNRVIIFSILFFYRFALEWIRGYFVTFIFPTFLLSILVLISIFIFKRRKFGFLDKIYIYAKPQFALLQLFYEVEI